MGVALLGSAVPFRVDGSALGATSVGAMLLASWQRASGSRGNRSLLVLLTMWPVARRLRCRCTSASTALVCPPSTHAGAAPGPSLGPSATASGT
eukprot:2043915-Alexandrium_andersonii.AAC.1